MRVIVLFVAIASRAASAEEVVEINTSNFHETITEPDLWLLKFYAPWCGHCKRLAPILEEVAAESASGVKFGKIDCTTDEKLCNSYGVKGFPQLIMVQGKMQWLYKGPRKKTDLQDLLVRMQQPAVRVLQSTADLEAMYAKSTVVFLQGRSSADEEASAAFEEAARAMMHTDSFAATDSPELLRQILGAPTDERPAPVAPFVARVEKGEEPRLLKGNSSMAARISAFVEAKRVPSFSLVDDSNFGTLMNAGRPLALLLLDVAAGEKKKRALTMDDSLHGIGAELRSLSRDVELREQFVFAMLDAADFEEYLQTTYYIERNTLPRMIVLNKGRMSTRSFYPDQPGEASARSTIRAFLERVTSGAEAGEFEGKMGIPARWWRYFCGYMPALASLDFLPRGTFVAPWVLLFFYGLYKLITSFPDEDYYDRDAAERTAIRAKAASKKGN